MDYSAVLNQAQELYAVMDALANEYLAVHREAEAQRLTHAKLHVQKILGVPEQLALVTKTETISGLPSVERIVPPPPVEPVPVHTVSAAPKRSHKRKV